MRQVIHQTKFGPWSKARLIDEIERLNKIIDERDATIKALKGELYYSRNTVAGLNYQLNQLDDGERK